MAFDVHETRASDSQDLIRLIDLTKEEQGAPFAVREADGSAEAVSGRIPDKAEILAWLEDHPVFVGIATGVLCFSIIAGAMSTVFGSDPSSDDPVAGAALSDTDGGQGSFGSSGVGGANFTSDESKLSRTGAGKVTEESADGETATGSNTKPNGPTRYPRSTDPATAGASNLDQSATVGARAPATGAGQSEGPASNAIRPSGTNSNVITDRSGSPTAAGNTPPTSTTSRASNSTASTNPTTVTTAGQTSLSSPSTAPTTAATTPTTTPTTPVPSASLSIAAPGNGSSHAYESSTSFAANFIPGATRYCWTFIQGGTTAREACSGATTYQLPARASNIYPGLVTVRATATGPFGTVTDSIQISLHLSDVIDNPKNDMTIGQGALRVGVVNVAGATRYCFRLTQVGYDSGSLCYSTNGNTFNEHDRIWDSLSPGSLTVSATAYGGGTLLASDSVTIQLLQ